MERLTAVRRTEADAAALVKDIREQAADLESAQENLKDLHRRLLDTGKPQEAEQAAATLAAAAQQAAQVQRLLPGVTEASQRLGTAARQLQARADAFRGPERSPEGKLHLGALQPPSPGGHRRHGPGR